MTGRALYCSANNTVLLIVKFDKNVLRHKRSIFAGWIDIELWNDWSRFSRNKNIPFIATRPRFGVCPIALVRIQKTKTLVWELCENKNNSSETWYYETFNFTITCRSLHTVLALLGDSWKIKAVQFVRSRMALLLQSPVEAVRSRAASNPAGHRGHAFHCVPSMTSNVRWRYESLYIDFIFNTYTVLLNFEKLLLFLKP